MRFFFSYFIFFCSSFLFAQDIFYVFPKKMLELGELAEMKITIKNIDQESLITEPKLNIFPVGYRIQKDSIFRSKNFYSRTIQFQFFEKGFFDISALQIFVGNKPLEVPSYQVNVFNSAKKTDQLEDIMDNSEISVSLVDYWLLYRPYVLVGLLFFTILFFLFAFLKGKRKKKILYSEHSIDKFFCDMEGLKEKKYIETESFRLFYVELIDITRNFLESHYKFPARYLLTDDLISFIKKEKILSKKNEEMIESVFQRADFVKFAQKIPKKEQMDVDYDAILNFIKNSRKNL